MDNKILVIDICGTLYKSNTTFDFIAFIFRNKFRNKLICFLRKKRIISKLNYAIFLLFGLDILRIELIKVLKGYTKNDLNSMVRMFYDGYLSDHKNIDCFKVIDHYRDKGYRLILVSATLDIIAKEISRREKISDYVASELLFHNDICTGKLRQDLLGKKIEKTLELTNGSSFDVITDNYSDGDIISAANHVYLVQYSNKRNKWHYYLNQETLRKCEFINI